MAENNTNNNTFSRDNLSEMDKIFIPEDLDDNVELSDFVSYKCGLKFWRTVPENCRLVTENRFTRKITFYGGFGLKWIPPIFTKTILVPAPMMEGIKTVKDIKCLSKDKIEVGIDLTLSMNITNPAKYMRKGKHQLKQLTSIVNRLLRVYIANKNFDDLVTKECDLYKFDPRGELLTFEEENGIRINKVIFEKIELPERLKKLYNDAAEEEQRRKAQEVKLRAEKEKATMDAEILKIKTEAEVERLKKLEEVKADAYINKMNKLIHSLKTQGIPDEGIAEYLKTVIMAEHGNAIFMGGNNRSNDIAMGIAAGNASKKRPTQSNPQVQTPPLSNSEKALKAFDALRALGIPETDGFKATYNRIRNDKKTRDYLDGLSDSEYEQLILPILNSFNINRNQGTDNSYTEHPNGPRR